VWTGSEERRGKIRKILIIFEVTLRSQVLKEGIVTIVTLGKKI
jgi:hypothetical protein